MECRYFPRSHWFTWCFSSKHTQVLTKNAALLVEPNPQAFADGILQVLDDPELAERLGKSAHQLARDKFGRQDYITKVNQIYKTLAPKLEIEERALSQGK